MANTVTVSGMFGNDKTYFADSPVIIDISGLEWPEMSPFTIVHVEVIYGNRIVGDFRDDIGGRSTAIFDIKSALKTIWSLYSFSIEQGAANAALTASEEQTAERNMREYALRISTEYLASDGVFTTTQCVAVINDEEYTEIPGGKCLIGGMTEWERSLITDDTKRDVSALEHTNPRNGDASTKPTSIPERVGKSSITSWTDVQAGYTKSIFYPATATPEDDDNPTSQKGWIGHAPQVLRDSIDYVDFLFVNRRGAVETCSGRTLESMGISVKTKQYSRVGTPTFQPSRSLMAIASGCRRSWQMSSGFQTREWAEWWTMEFLMARQKWMLYKGPGRSVATYVPVIVEPDKENISIYDKTKQQMPHVDFTVTLALEEG